ncbi:MAG: histidine kinase [Burkholderiales bacterium PBB5]|nr:MAG: histidine kinase [Burkholderiales bacterium PBB5]
MGLENSGLLASGFSLVLLAHAVYGAHLVHSGHLRPPRSASAWVYFAAVVLSALWGAASLLDLFSSKQLSWHLAVALDHLRYAAWYAFLLLLLRPMADRLDPRGRWASLLLPGLLLATGLGLDAWAGMTGMEPARIARALLAVQLAWAVCGLLLVEQVFRNQVDQARWGAKPLCLALGALCVFDVYLFSQAMMFGHVDDDVLAARGLVHAMTVPLLFMASKRQAAWLRKIQVSQAAAFYSATLLLIGAYLLFIAGVGYYLRFFGGSWGGALQVVLLFSAVVALLVLVLSGSARARLRVFLGKNFFSYRYDYRREWLRFTAMLSTKSSPQEVGGLVVRGLADMVESPAGGLWFKALGDDGFVQSARWNLPESAHRELPDTARCQFMREREGIIELGNPRAAAADAPPAPAWLAALGPVWLVIPLLVADELIGFVLLAPPRTAVELDWEVRDLLKTAARQAAGFLAQMHAAEALLESRKFDAFNRMSAFVVHDLKNIITQLSLMLKNAERLREGSKPAGVASGVDLVPILQRMQTMAQQRGRALELDIVDRIATRGHEERLERVIGHVVQNALDATPPTGRVWATLQQSAGRAQVVVGDTGVGMSQEFIQSRLFRPFSSTKSSGMGIGSYESFQYIKELGGSIDVKSEVGQGSVMTILLPLFDSRTGTDLRAGASQ